MPSVIRGDDNFDSADAINIDASTGYSSFTLTGPTQNTTGRTRLLYYYQPYNVSNNVQVSSDGATYYTISTNSSNSSSGFIVWYPGHYVTKAGNNATCTVIG